jgi:hypothetical protein
MNIISINFNIEGIADYFIGLLQGSELHLVEQDVAALPMMSKQCDQLIQAMQLLKMQGKFDPTKIADYSAVFETAGLPPMMPYAMETLMANIETTMAMGENPQVQIIVHEVMLVPSKIVNY